MKFNDIAVAELEIPLHALTIELPLPPDLGKFQLVGEILVQCLGRLFYGSGNRENNGIIIVRIMPDRLGVNAHD